MISFFKATLLQETVILQMVESRRAERLAPRFTATEVEQPAFKLVRRQQPASGHVQLIVEAFPQPVQRQTAEEQVQSVLIRIEQGAGQFGQKAQDSGHEIQKQGAQAVRMKDQYAAVEVVRRVQAFFHYCPPAPSAV